jgi:hypothetical protein
MKVKVFVNSFFLFVLILIGSDCVAQGRPCPRQPCPQTPITGIEILIAGGAALGIKKLIKAKNQA